jgi:hypothetical protein
VRGLGKESTRSRAVEFEGEGRMAVRARQICVAAVRGVCRCGEARDGQRGQGSTRRKGQATRGEDEQEVDGGGQGQCTALVAGEPGEQRRRAEEQGLREEEGGRMEPRTILQNQRNTGTSL